ncbi:MAG: STAS domain-containing protein [Burkholderiales bacterium]|nr:STAS domain-containing protein [Burkholderiales bacterium]
MTEFKLEDRLLLNNINGLLKLITKLINSTPVLNIDLSAVVNVDSAGIAFLLELKAIAKQKKCQVNFTHIPDVVDKFCQLYKVAL